MFRLIVIYGVIAGVIVVTPMIWLMTLATPETTPHNGLLFGYLTMIVALTAVFLGIKHYRDRVLGGAIRFVPALLVGLGISTVASLIYVLGWELSLVLSKSAFAQDYAKSMVDAARARGASAAELQKVSAEAASFVKQYANPLYRMSVTFLEIFPVGVFISLLSAALLRNSRLLPARART